MEQDIKPSHATVPLNFIQSLQLKKSLNRGGGGQLSISVRIEDHTNRNWLTKVRGKTVEERLNLPFYLVSHCLKIFIDNNNGRYG